MTTKHDGPPPINDNKLICISGALAPGEISDRLEAVLDELSAQGAADAALIEALFSSMTEIAYSSACITDDDLTGRDALGRYNQLSRFSGELEGLKAIAQRRWSNALTEV